MVGRHVELAQTMVGTDALTQAFRNYYRQWYTLLLPASNYTTVHSPVMFIWWADLDLLRQMWTPMSTSHPPDIIHMMNSPRPSLLFAALPFPCIIVNANQRTKNGVGWEQGYMWTMVHPIIASFQLHHCLLSLGVYAGPVNVPESCWQVTKHTGNHNLYTVWPRQRTLTS